MSSERGSAMVTSLLAVAVLSILAATTYRLTRTLVRETVWQLRSAQAQAIAEAGLEDALRRLYEDPSWRTGFADKPFAGGRYTVTVSTDAEPLVSSTGFSAGIALFGPALRSVAARARLLTSGSGSGSGTSFAVLTNDFQSQGAVVDSFVTPGPSGAEGSVWSNGGVDIRCSLPPCIMGSVYFRDTPAPDPARVLGAVVRSTFSLALPGHACPSCAGSHDLSVGNGKTLALAAGVHYFRNITVKGTLNIHTPATVYFNGKLTTDSSCAINNLSETPSLLAFYGQGSSSSHFLGCDQPLYAYLEDRTGDFTFDTEVFGRVWGDKVEFQSGTRFHADIVPSGAGTVTGADWAPGSWTAGYARP